MCEPCEVGCAHEARAPPGSRVRSCCRQPEQPPRGYCCPLDEATSPQLASTKTTDSPSPRRFRSTGCSERDSPVLAQRATTRARVRAQPHIASDSRSRRRSRSDRGCAQPRGVSHAHVQGQPPREYEGVVRHDLSRGDVRCSKMLVRNQMHTACNVAHQQVAIVAQRADLARHERHLVRPPRRFRARLTHG